jgi:hypothetical protein
VKLALGPWMTRIRMAGSNTAGGFQKLLLRVVVAPVLIPLFIPGRDTETGQNRSSGTGTTNSQQLPLSNRFKNKRVTPVTRFSLCAKRIAALCCSGFFKGDKRSAAPGKKFERVLCFTHF